LDRAEKWYFLQFDGDRALIGLIIYLFARIDAAIGMRGGNHTFRAMGVTAYLKNGGTLERVAQTANHASTRTTQLYDRRAEKVTLDEVERVLIWTGLHEKVSRNPVNHKK
jgi:integrase